MTLRCPSCHVPLVYEVVLGVAPAPTPTRAERIALADELDSEACGRRWALDVEREQLAELEDEQRRAAGMTDEPGRGR
jgi:hypothetical protein